MSQTKRKVYTSGHLHKLQKSVLEERPKLLTKPLILSSLVIVLLVLWPGVLLGRFRSAESSKNIQRYGQKYTEVGIYTEAVIYTELGFDS